MSEPSPLIPRRRWIALVVLCVGQLMISLDTTVANVALPSIQRELHFSAASLAWVINGYLITFAGFLLLAGRLGDLVGRKRVFIAGLVIFTVASAWCGLSRSAAMLIGARLLQGIGAATIGVVVVAIIASSFRGPTRVRAIGVLSATAMTGQSIGLLTGGVLTQELGWHWIFFINLPIAIVVIPLALLLIEPHEGLGLGDGVDALGAVLITTALMVGCYAIVGASSHGWLSTVTLGGGTAALALVALFIVREQSTAHPLVELRIFRSRNMSGANVARGLLGIGYFAVLFLLSLYLQQRLHYSPVRTGLAFLPMALLNALASIAILARLLNRIGAKRTLLIGYALMIAALLAFAQLPAHASYLQDLLPGFLLLGVGVPLAFNAAIILAMSSVSTADFGVAAGLSNVFQQVSGAIGLAVVATLLATRTRDLLSAGHSAAVAAVGGDHLALTVVALILVAGLALSAFVLRSPYQGKATVADRLADSDPSVPRLRETE